MASGGELRLTRRAELKQASRGNMKLASRDGLSFVERTIESWHTIFQQK